MYHSPQSFKRLWKEKVYSQVDKKDYHWYRFRKVFRLLLYSLLFKEKLDNEGIVILVEMSLSLCSSKGPLIKDLNEKVCCHAINHHVLIYFKLQNQRFIINLEKPKLLDECFAFSVNIHLRFDVIKPPIFLKRLRKVNLNLIISHKTNPKNSEWFRLNYAFKVVVHLNFSSSKELKPSYG